MSRLVQSHNRIAKLYTPLHIPVRNGTDFYPSPAKFVCNDKFAVCGALNLDYHSLAHYFECGACMYETDCIADIKADFLRTDELSVEIDKNKVVMRSWLRFIAEVLKIFSPLL